MLRPAWFISTYDAFLHAISQYSDSMQWAGREEEQHRNQEQFGHRYTGEWERDNSPGGPVKRFRAYLLLSSITNRSSVGSDIVDAQCSPPSPGSVCLLIKKKPVPS